MSFASKLLPSWELRISYRDEIVFWKTAGFNVVLEELLGEVLVHLCCLVCIHGIATGFVQVCKRRASVCSPRNTS